MPDEARQQDVSVSDEMQDVVRTLVSAIRAVKLYPPNNSIYGQSVAKAFDSLRNYLGRSPECRIGVQKSWFTDPVAPIGKDTQLNKSVAQDLFSKGVRGIVFKKGLSDKEVLDICLIFALSTEELAMKSGIPSILWEKGISHIQVTEAGLDEVVAAPVSPDGAKNQQQALPLKAISESAATREIAVGGRSIALGDMMKDPAGFGAGMVAAAVRLRSDGESVEDKLYSLYQESSRKILETSPNQADALFDGMAHSLLSLESPYRESIISGRLYRDLDAESVGEQKLTPDQPVPNNLHEVLTGRFSRSWNANQVAELLKKKASEDRAVEPKRDAPRVRPELVVLPLNAELRNIAQEMAEYTAEEMDALKIMSDSGMESDIIEAAARILLHLFELIKTSHQSAARDKDIARFGGIVKQLEIMHDYLMKKKDYDRASLIVRAFRLPVEQHFKARIWEAIRKTTSRADIVSTVNDLRTNPPDSAAHASAYAYLKIMEREATEVMLELLAEEQDRSGREFLIEKIKDLGKNQLVLIGERLSDERWYVVRNIVMILGESKTDQVVSFFHKVAHHKNNRIREEIIKGLIGIGGRKASSLLIRFLDDYEPSLQLMAMNGLVEIGDLGSDGENAFMDYLEQRPLKQKYQDMTLEAIRAMGKLGGPDSVEFLKRYTRMRWWRSRRLQAELRTAALSSIDQIRRRQANARRGQR